VNEGWWDRVLSFQDRSITFAEARLHQPGDEGRTIDWNVAARTEIVAAQPAGGWPTSTSSTSEWRRSSPGPSCFG
jgi:Protein of unknown function DUF58